MVLPSARQLSFLFTADKTLSIFVISTGEEMKMMLHTKRGVEMNCTDTVSGKPQSQTRSTFIGFHHRSAHWLFIKWPFEPSVLEVHGA